MGKDQDIRLKIEAVGADKAAGDVGKVDAAQKGLTDQTKDATKPTQELDEATKKLTATEETYTSLLSRVHPALGAVADMMVKGSKVAGDFATQQISLREVLQKSTGAVRANWNAIKLFLAGGAVIAAISAISAAVRAMREEWDRATAAIKAHRDALNEIKGAERERQQTIEDISDVRRDGGMTAEQAGRAAQTAERVKQEFPQIGDAAINQVAGLLGDRLSRDQMAQAAILQKQAPGGFQLEPTMTIDTMMMRLDNAMNRYGEYVERFMARESTQRAGRWPEGRREALAADGSTVNIEDLIRELLPAGTDAKRLAELAQVYGTAEGLRQYEEGNVDPVTGRPALRTKFDLPDWIPLIGGAGTVKQRGTDVERAQLGILLDALKANTQAVEEATREAARTPQTVNYHNSRFTYPDAHTQRRETRNGQNYRTRMGDG